MPDIGLVKGLDPETAREVWVDTSSKKVREAYAGWWKTRERETSDMFARCGIDNVSLSTAEDYIIPLMKLFKMR